MTMEYLNRNIKGRLEKENLVSEMRNIRDKNMMRESAFRDLLFITALFVITPKL